MLDKEILWLPSGLGQIVRFFSCDNTGSILYSWKHTGSTKLQSYTFIRHFNSASNVDEVVFVSNGVADILHASLSADHCLIAITICCKSDQISVDESVFQAVTDLSEDVIREITDICPIASREFSTIGSITSQENLYTDSETEVCSSIDPNNLLYKSYIAQTHPTGWVGQFCGHHLSSDGAQKSFTTDEKLVKKPIFTNFKRRRETGDILLSEYGIILITNKYVGLCSLTLQEDSSVATQTDLRVAGKKFTIQSNIRRSKIFGNPDSEILSENVIWSQWDPLLQRLYYLVPRKTPAPKSNTTACVLFCTQFFPETQRKKVFEVEVGLTISLSASIECSRRHSEFDLTTCNHGLNMTLCLLYDSGLLCLCWQEALQGESSPEYSYHVMVLNKNVKIKKKLKKEEASEPLSFFALGHNLIVHSPGCFVHVYDVEHLNSDLDQMHTGLYHLLLKESNYPQLVNTSLKYIMPNQLPDVSGYLDDNMSWSSNDSFDSTLADVRRQSSICYDSRSRSFFSFFLDSERFSKLFSNKDLSLQNRVFLTRQAVWMSKYDDFNEKWIAPVISYVSKEPTNQSVTVILSQLLIGFTYLNLLEPTVGVPSLLLGFFPVSLPASVFYKFVTIKEKEKCDVTYESIELQTTIKQQVEQFVSLLLFNVEKMTSLFVMNDGDDEIEESVSTAWIRTRNACESSSYLQYNLECIRDQLNNLEEAYPHPGIINDKKIFNQSRIFQQRLSKKLRRNNPSSSGGMSSSRDELLRSLDKCPQTWSEFLDESEKNIKSDNLLVLTYTKLCDHLLAHCKQAEPEDLELMARNYVHAQIQATHRLLSLIMMKFGVKNINKPLFIRASSSDQSRFFALNQFQLVCEVTCFPLPNGFHTLITCLTFRSLLARYPYPSDANILSEEIIAHFTQCFFDYVDRKLIQLTDAFVDRVLNELGDRDTFESVVEQVFLRTLLSTNNKMEKIENLKRWKSRKAEELITEAYLEELFKYGVNKNGLSLDDASKPRSQSDANSQQSVPEMFKQMQSRHRADTLDGSPSDGIDFPPFDAYMKFIRKTEESLPDEERSYNIGLIEKTVIQQVG